MIGKKVLADMNITAVIAPKIGQNGKCTIGAAQQLNKQLVALRFLGNWQVVDLPANFLGSYALLCQCRIFCVVQFPAQHAFLFGFHISSSSLRILRPL